MTKLESIAEIIDVLNEAEDKMDFFTHLNFNQILFLTMIAKLEKISKQLTELLEQI